MRRPFLERLWAKVEVGDAFECWPWVGGKTGVGTPACRFNGVSGCPARQYIYKHKRGKIPEGHRIYMRCASKLCMNPHHMIAAHPNRGSHNGRAVLTEDDVREVRMRHGEGETIASLAKEYGVWRNAMSRAIRGKKAWSHV